MQQRGISITWDQKNNIIRIRVNPRASNDPRIEQGLRTLSGTARATTGRPLEIPWTYENEIRLHELFSSPTPTLHRYLKPLRQELKRRLYSKRTIETYLGFNRRFLLFTRKTPAETRGRDLGAFLDTLRERESSAATINLAISGLKIFYQDILQMDLFADIIRPKLKRSPPIVLSIHQVSALIHAPGNARNRALLALAYSGGLRVSECVVLRWGDIDRRGKSIYVAEASAAGDGNNHRLTIVSKIALGLLDDYARLFESPPDPADWVFPGQDPARPLSTRSAEKIFESARLLIGLGKEVSLHSLRHAFAAHMLEHGVDLPTIQKLLGHRSARTTRFYSKRDDLKIHRITSPLDEVPPPEEP